MTSIALRLSPSDSAPSKPLRGIILAEGSKRIANEYVVSNDAIVWSQGAHKFHTQVLTVTNESWAARNLRDTISIMRAPSTPELEAASQALERLKSRQNMDADEWADALANNIAHLKD